MKNMYERTYTKSLKQNVPPEKKRRRRFPLKRFLWILTAFLIASILVVFIRWPKLQIRQIEVAGTNVADPEELEAFVWSHIEGNYLYFFPRSSMLLVPTAIIDKKITQRYPRFAFVDVRRKGVDGLSVTVTEHEGAYLWCTNDEECFFMTEEGLVFAEAPFFSGDAYQRIFWGDKKEFPFEPLTLSELDMVKILAERLPSIGIEPAEFRQVSKYQMDVVFSHRGKLARLLIDPTANIEDVLEDLATGIGTEPLKGQLADQSKILQYLDARFANKVVYKFLSR